MLEFTDGRVVGQVNATDPDADALTYSSTAASVGGGTVTVNPNGSFTYIPTALQRLAADPNLTTIDSFTVMINDGHGGTVTRTVSVPPSRRPPLYVFHAPTVGLPDTATGLVLGQLGRERAEQSSR